MKLTTALYVGLSATLMFMPRLPLLSAAQTTNPKNPDMVIRSMAGRDLFQFYCASCHGVDGKGNGHAARALKVTPPDLTTLIQRNRGTFPAAELEAFIKGVPIAPSIPDRDA